MDQNVAPSPPDYFIRCPEDILRLIFKTAISGSNNPDVNLKLATRVAAVCGSWRFVALKMPRMWNGICLRMGSNDHDLEDYWARTIERVGKVPVTITVSNMCSKWPKNLSRMIKDASLTIDSLHLEFKHSGDISRLVEIWGYVPVESTDLTVSSSNEPNAEGLSSIHQDTPRASDISCGHLLKAVHCRRRLSIIGWEHAFVFPSTIQNARCVQLHISKVEYLEVYYWFHQFSSVEYLFLSRCSLLLYSTNVTIPTLRSLHIKQCKNPESLMDATFPSLETFCYSGLIPRHLLRFLERHQRIANLSLDSDSLEDITPYQLVKSASQTVSLTVPLCWVSDLIENGAFSSLRSLTLINNSTSFRGLDYLLKARLLPRSHPQSVATDPSRVVDELFIDMEQSDMYANVLLKHRRFTEATKEVQREPDSSRVRIKISWPMHSLGPLEGSAASTWSRARFDAKRLYQPKVKPPDARE